MKTPVALSALLLLVSGLVRCGPPPAAVSAPIVIDPVATSKPGGAVASAPPVTPPPTIRAAPTPPLPPVDQLQVTIVSPGSGPEARAGDVVEVSYVGTFVDGTEFDSSTRPGRRPFRFKLGQGSVIKGWEQGVVGMKVGGARRLVIPPELAYGAHGRSGIPASSTLVFDIELLAINPP